MLAHYHRPLPMMTEYDQLLGSGVRPMSATLNELQGRHDQSNIARCLRVPMIASSSCTLAEQAIREKKTHIGYLEALLAAEVEERERNTIDRRIKEAQLPRMKDAGRVRLHASRRGHGCEDARSR